MAKKLTRKDHMRCAANAKVDIHVLGAVIGLLDSGAIVTRRGESAKHRIIAICNQASGQLLGEMDAAEARALEADHA